MNKTFSDSALLSLGWRQALDKLGFFVLLFFVSIAAVAAPLLVFGVALEDYPVIAWLAYLGYIVLLIIMSVGYIKIALNIVDGQKPNLKDLFVHWNRVLTFLGTSILFGIIVFVGFSLFFIPGCIWMTKFYLAPYFAIDKGMNPIEALRASSEATMGAKWDVFAFYILIQIVVMLGFFAFGIGLLVTVPLTMIATAALYRILSGGKVKIK